MNGLCAVIWYFTSWQYSYSYITVNAVVHCLHAHARPTMFHIPLVCDWLSKKLAHPKFILLCKFVTAKNWMQSVAWLSSYKVKCIADTEHDFYVANTIVYGDKIQLYSSTHNTKFWFRSNIYVYNSYLWQFCYITTNYATKKQSHELIVGHWNPAAFIPVFTNWAMCS